MYKDKDSELFKKEIRTLEKLGVSEDDIDYLLYLKQKQLLSEKWEN